MISRSAVRVCLFVLSLQGFCIGPPTGILLWQWRQEIRLERRENALLFAAIEQNDANAALAALHSHADPNCRERGSAPLSFRDFVSARLGRAPRRRPSSARDGLSALALAVQKNNSAIVEALTTHGARDVGDRLSAENGTLQGDDRSRARDTCTLLMYASSRANPAIVSALSRSGSNINAVDSDRDTVLFYAVDALTVDALADCGADLNAKDKFDLTALDIHSSKGDVAACRALIRRGAKDAKAMEWATFFGNAATIRDMLDAGWDINTRNENGRPPLMTALNSGGGLQPEVALVLIERGADVNIRDKNGDTPLLFAADGGRYPEMDEKSPAVVKALLAQGARVDARNNDGTTPLMVAAFRLRPVLVRLLLQHGARVNARAKDGATALSVARNDNPYRGTHGDCQPAVIQLLRQAGAKE